MTIEILLSTYNGERFLDTQMESLLKQTYKDIRLIIRDDGSKDGTKEKLKLWKERFPEKIELYLEQNVGVIESFNRLFMYSKAPYLAFCDQDDYWLPEKLERCFALLDKDKPSLVHSDLKVVDAELQEIHPSFWGYAFLSGKEKYATLPRLLIQNVVTGCTTLMTRPLGEIAFPVPKDAVMHDWWLALVAACFGSIRSCSDPLIHYRQHGNNTVGAKPFSILGSPRTQLSRLLQSAKHDKQKCMQAENLIERFRDRLDKKRVELIEAFMGLQKRRGFSRISTILRYKFYKIGWQRNLIHLLQFRFR